jgi:hypothetical protein
MKTIVQSLDINKQPLHLMVKVSMGGKTVVHQKANSLTVGFLAMLARSMNADEFLREDILSNTYNTTRRDLNKNIPVFNPALNTGANSPLPENFPVTSATGNQITVTHSTSGRTFDLARNPTTDYVSLRTIGGNEGNSGTYRILNRTASGTTATVITLEGFTSDGTVPTSAYFHGRVAGTSSDVGLVRGMWIGNSNVPVKLQDRFLHGAYTTEFAPSGVTISEPNIFQNTGKIIVSQTFTNTSGALQTVNEIGLASRAGNTSSTSVYQWINVETESTFLNITGYPWIFIARDIIQPVVVAPSDALTIQYEITTNHNGKNGFTSNFIQLLFRQISGTSRVVRDTDNLDKNSDPSTRTFFTGIGSSKLRRIDSSLIGIQVGTHTGSMATDSYNLLDDIGVLTRIPSGTVNNTLRYYGTMCEGITQVSDNLAYLDLLAVFENQGNVSINVNELGLFSDPTGTYAVCVARSILPEEQRQVVQPGEFLKVIYRISISTGN